MGSLSSAQHSIIIGSILGDGALRLQQGKLNALFECNSSIRQEMYILWKYRMLQTFVTTPPRVRQTNGRRYACRFTTRSLPVFTKLYRYFYRNGRKRIHDDLLLDELALAVWFMDDGSKSRSSYYLNTQQFSIQDQQRLMQSLWHQWKIATSLNRDKEYYRIRLRTASAARWRFLIEPLVLPWFRYKLTDDPVTTDSKDEAFLVQALAGRQHADAHNQQLTPWLSLQRSVG